MIAYFVHCSRCGDSHKYREEFTEDESTYEQKDTDQTCPTCIGRKVDSPESRLLNALFGEEVIGVSLW